MRMFRRGEEAACPHLDAITDVGPPTEVCEDCLREGPGGWLSLHQCLTCGHVGCCASSPGKHAKKHHAETGHPIIQSVRRGWRWCYPDSRYV